MVADSVMRHAEEEREEEEREHREDASPVSESEDDDDDDAWHELSADQRALPWSGDPDSIRSKVGLLTDVLSAGSRASCWG